MTCALCVLQVWRCVLALATGGAAKAPYVPRRQHILWRGSRWQDCWAGRVHRSQWESLCGPLSQWRVPWPRHVLPGGRTGRGEPLLRRTGGGSGCRMERRSSEGVAPRRSKRKGRRDEACGHFSGRCRFDCEGAWLACSAPSTLTVCRRVARWFSCSLSLLTCHPVRAVQTSSEHECYFYCACG